MALTENEVRHIARLARLALSEDELEKYRGQLSAILDYVAQLSDLDTSGIEPTSSVLPPGASLRPDRPRPGLDPEALRQNAPDWEADQFRVPPILD
jgi:aspartyl-tRNA(Asn)/glutamyl-tRNA(Gln) amidotransferase subunit C